MLQILNKTKNHYFLVNLRNGFQIRNRSELLRTSLLREEFLNKEDKITVFKDVRRW